MKKKIMPLIILFIFGLYLYFENTSCGISNYIIRSDKLPHEFQNYKIIQISDYHNEKSNRLNQHIISTINTELPDIIVITGDFIDSRHTDINQAIQFIKEIKDIAPIYYVIGNHETRISNYPVLKQRLEEQGVRILGNETHILEIGNSKINIIGINDPDLLKDEYIDDRDKIENELENSHYDSQLFSILLSHRPELFSTYVDHNIDLVLAGHAHGGQIRFPFIGGLIAPHQGLFPLYTNGVYNENNTSMVVSRGIGNSLFPFRVNNNPELVIVHLIH